MFVCFLLANKFIFYRDLSLCIFTGQLEKKMHIFPIWNYLRSNSPPDHKIKKIHIKKELRFYRFKQVLCVYPGSRRYLKQEDHITEIKKQNRIKNKLSFNSFAFSTAHRTLQPSPLWLIKASYLQLNPRWCIVFCFK